MYEFVQLYRQRTDYNRESNAIFTKHRTERKSKKYIAETIEVVGSGGPGAETQLQD